ncbi:MAG: adenylyltransferase/cytidyltransferase family protein [Flavobacteriaceae bacterium]|nr:adenylyltransferase/cytidyltransferase family protein [Flavobacteriaceae bacterium]MBL6685086.1 adenylyltransferase/cytidyltransferase family protein [Flavobacteriaceae bacterium]
MVKGLIAGNFDVIHPGYIKSFIECKENCDHFTVLLHSDPTIERPNKLKPILTVEERIEILSSLKYIDDIKVYTYEKELIELLQSGEFNIRFLGDDYIGKSFTGDKLNIDIHYLSRSHGWSTTKFKKLIAETVKTKK